MAYISDTLTAISDAAASSYDAPLPAHVAGDLLMVLATNDGGGTTLATATSGWAAIGTQASSGGNRQAWFWKIATSSAEPDPTITGTSDDWISTALVIKGAHPTDPIDGNARTDWVNIDNPTSPAISIPAGHTNTLVLHSFCSDGTVHIHVPPSSMVPIGQDRVNNVHLVGYTNQRADGAVTQITGIVSTTNEGGNVWTILIRDDGNGSLGPDPVANINIISPYSKTTDSTFVPPSTHLTTIDGVGMDTVATMSGNNAMADGWGAAVSANSANVNQPQWSGFTDQRAAPINMIGKIFAFNFQHSNLARVGLKGLLLVLQDSVGNWSAYRFALKKYIIAGRSYAVYIDLASAIPIFTSGTLDLTQVDRIHYLWHRTVNTATGFAVKQPTLLDATVTLSGGSLVAPIKPNWLHKAVSEYGAYSRSVLAGEDPKILGSSGQLGLKQSYTIGDGTTPTVFDANGASFETPIPYSEAAGQVLWNMANGVKLTVKACAACAIRIRNCVMVALTRSDFIIDPTSSASATYDFSGSYWQNWDIVWKTGITLNGAIIRDCGEVDLKAGTANGVRFRDPLDAALVKVDDGASFSNCEFIAGDAADYAIRIPAAGTYTFNSLCTFSGFTTDINITAAAGTITIVLPSGMAQPTYQTAGATVVFDTPTLNTVFSAPNFPTGTTVGVYNLTTDSVIEKTTLASPGYSKTCVPGVDYNVGDTIELRAIKVSGATATQEYESTVITTSGGGTVPISTSLEPCAIYNELAIDGSAVTGYAADYVDDEVDITVASNFYISELFAWWKYNLTTDDGMRYFWGGIVPFDIGNIRVVNSLVNIKLDNTTATDVWALDNRRFYRDDGARPIKFPTTGGGGIDVEWREKVLIAETGTSGLTSEESTKLSSIDALSKLIPACIK